MINNFEKILTLLNFESEDDFYHLQLIKRKKENPELGSNSRIIKTYYIKDINDLDKYKDEIIGICTVTNSRACINLNKRSFEKMAFHNLKKNADIIMNKDYKSVRNSYESVCGRYSNESEKKWIIDVDKPYNENFINAFKNISYNAKPEGDKIIAILPTKNGYHIICKAFDTRVAQVILYELDVHRDNPTLLFIP